MAAIPVPSLTAKGWVFDIIDRCDRLMSYFFTTMQSQSYLYYNRVTNIQYLIQQYGKDPIQLTAQIKIALETYLQRYFDFVDADVSTNATSVDFRGGPYSVTISVLVKEGSQSYSVVKQLMMSDSILQKILDVNNNG